MFSIPDIENGTYGEPPGETFDDLEDTAKIRNIITDNPARTVDHLVLSQDPKSLKTALVIGLLIYGTGRGPGNTRSIQAPEMARVTLERGEGFRVGAGKSVWSNVHVRDLGMLFANMAKAAVEGRSGCWNGDGVYAVANGQQVSQSSLQGSFVLTFQEFGRLGENIAVEAHAQGLIKSPKVEHTMTADEANKAMPAGATFWATNAVAKATRARKQLNWQPSHPSLYDTIQEVVKIEAERLER